MGRHLFILLITCGIFLKCGKTSDDARSVLEVATATVLEASDIEAALSEHNEARSRVNPTSNNMLKLTWDHNLAQTAQEYSRQCKYVHSSGISTPDFERIGENLYIKYPEESPTLVLKNAIKHWEDEKYDYNFTTDSCSDICGHYTQLVWDDTYAVGCGVTTCHNVKMGSEIWPVGQLVVCHYGPIGNMVGRRPYRIGTSCSVCPRNYQCENNLCSFATMPMISRWLIAYATLCVVLLWLNILKV